MNNVISYKKFSDEVMGIKTKDATFLLMPKTRRIVTMKPVDLGIIGNELGNIVESLPVKKVCGTEEENIFAPFAGGIFLTSDCNLRCVYCYARGGEKQKYMNWQLAHGAAIFLINNAKEFNINPRISFHGGGEPTMNWSILTKVVALIQKECRQYGLTPSFSISTNGILSEKKAAWVAENINHIQLSFDGPKSIQDFQRPGIFSGFSSYEYAMATAATFKKLGKKFVSRTTVLAENINKMPEISDFILEELGASMIHVEPVFHDGRGINNPLIKTPDQGEFLEQLLKLQTSSKFSGKIFALAKGMFKDKYCGAAGYNFLVTPDGIITSCYEVLTRDDERAKIFQYGYYDEFEKKFIIDHKKFDRLGQRKACNVKGCDECFAEFNCAGGCLAKHANANSDSIFSFQKNFYCDVEKGLVLHTLENMREGGTEITIAPEIAAKVGAMKVYDLPCTASLGGQDQTGAVLCCGCAGHSCPQCSHCDDCGCS
jgi:uncharacterized protein